MYQFGELAKAIPDICYTLIGIFMVHSLYKTPKKKWQCVVAWSLSTLFCGVMGEIFVRLWPLVSQERYNMFFGFAGILVYMYLFSNIPIPQRFFTYFMVDNSMYLLTLVARTLTMVTVQYVWVPPDLLFICIYCMEAVLFCMIFTWKLKPIILRSMRFFRKNLWGLTIFSLSCYICIMLAIDVWAPWPILTLPMGISIFAIVLTNLGGYILAFQVLQTMSERVQAESETMHIREQLYLSERYYQDLVPQIEQVRRMNHDLRHHTVTM